MRHSLGKFVATAWVAFTCMALLGTPANADTIYYYTGSPYTVSDSPITLFRWLDFFVGLSANASRPRDYAARRSAERCAAQPQGMSSSRRDAGQRLTSFVSTSAK
jgi:hypothetical protein